MNLYTAGTGSLVEEDSCVSKRNLSFYVELFIVRMRVIYKNTEFEVGHVWIRYNNFGMTFV